MEDYTALETLTYMFDGLGWFIGAFVVAILWTAYLSVVADIKFIFRFVAIPAWLIFTVGLLVVIDGFMGFPYPGVPPQTQPISYRVVNFKNPDEATIESWMYLIDEKKTRLYRFPYTKTREEALKQAMEKLKRGFKVEVDLNINKTTMKEDGVPSTAEDMLKYDLRHKGLPLKGDADDRRQAQEQSTQKKQQPIDDKYMIRLPGGTQIEIKPGSTVSIGVDGELEISAPKIPEAGMYPDFDPENMRMEH